jgi:hypothetical protein
MSQDTVIQTASQEVKEEVNKNYLEFLKELYSQGMYLSDFQLSYLKKWDVIDMPDTPKKTKKETIKPITEEPKELDEKYLEYTPLDSPEITDDIYETDTKDSTKAFTKTVETTIKKTDWLPESKTNHSKEFVLWIDSINSGFQNRIYYEKFELYKKQCDQWLSDTISLEDLYEEEMQYDYMIQELERCSINSLYAANKYYWLKDPYTEGGQVKYLATDVYEHQRICCYLFDCGYSVMIGKPRQPGITSIFGILGMNRILSRKNYFLKFIAESKEKSEEIFEDKIKFSFYSLDGWFQPSSNGRPDVLNDRDNLFRIGRKGQKGQIEGLNSKIQVVAPSKTAINGGSPPLVFIDEIGSIPILTEMINEGRPTMFKQNRTTGDLEVAASVFAWGTGTVGRGGGAFENEWKRLMSLWKEGDYTGVIIPLFFDWTTRCSEKEYQAQKRYYYGSRAKEIGIDVETSKTQFHQHFPTTPDDMFATTQKTLVAREECEKQIKKIYNIQNKLRPTYGYFEPVYDRSQRMPEGSDVPFKIVDAAFVPTDELSDDATTIIFQHPKPRWKNRYYQGTDPISADTGTSKMASAIWDKYYKTFSALTNFRKANDPNYCFLQCMLLGLYYDKINRIGVPELVEKNIGLAYKNYKQERGLHRNLMYNAELPDFLRSGSDNGIGIDNKGNRNKAIINKMYEVFTMYGERIYISTFYEQHKTFVCTTTRSGEERWGSVDHRYYFDDALFGGTFAFIAAESYPFRTPQNLEAEKKVMKTVYETVYDNNYNMHRVPKKQVV